jgi:type VI protein secretion system component Hcp
MIRKAEVMSDPDKTKNELTEEQLETVAGGAFIKSWSTSGDADDRPTEEVAFYYNKIAFNYSPTSPGKK